MNNQVKMVKNKAKEIRRLRESFRDVYNQYASDFSELNKMLLKLAEDVDKLLETIEVANQLPTEKKDDE